MCSARIPDSGRYVALSAHIIPFSGEYTAEYSQQGSRIYGPGVSDNGAGVAAMLGLRRC